MNGCLVDRPLNKGLRVAGAGRRDDDSRRRHRTLSYIIQPSSLTRSHMEQNYQ